MGCPADARGTAHAEADRGRVRSTPRRSSAESQAVRNPWSGIHMVVSGSSGPVRLPGRTDRGMVGRLDRSNRSRPPFGPVDVIFSGRPQLIFGTPRRSSGNFRRMLRRPVFVVFRRPSRAVFAGHLHRRSSWSTFALGLHPGLLDFPGRRNLSRAVIVQKLSGGLIRPCDLLSGILQKLAFKALGRSERWRRPRVARSRKVESRVNWLTGSLSEIAGGGRRSTAGVVSFFKINACFVVPPSSLLRIAGASMAAVHRPVDEPRARRLLAAEQCVSRGEACGEGACPAECRRPADVAPMRGRLRADRYGSQSKPWMSLRRFLSLGILGTISSASGKTAGETEITFGITGRLDGRTWSVAAAGSV